MGKRPILTVLLTAWVGWAGPLPPLAAADAPVSLPAALAKAVHDAQADLHAGRADAAVARLRAYAGEDHALRHLVLGHALAQQAQWVPAGEEYAKALAMAPTLTDAGVALAQVRAAAGQWKQAGELLGRYLNVDTCTAERLALYAQVADRLADRRLGRILVDKAIARFPADKRFRRLDLALLIDTESLPAARGVAGQLLGENPTDAGLWDQLAFVSHGKDDSPDVPAALEAALLCRPDDLDRHERFLSAQLTAGHWLAAVRHGRDLLAGPMGARARARTTLMALLIQAADAAEDDQAVAAWLAIMPQARRNAAMHLARARLALRQKKPAEARAALARLIEAGQTQPAVFLWAGHLAETRKDFTAAVALYEQARRQTGPQARLATLYLARLFLRTQQRQRGRQLLAEHLAQHPADSHARALLQVMSAPAAPDARAPAEPASR